MDFMLNLADKLQVEVDRGTTLSLLGTMRCLFVCISKFNAVILLAVASSGFLGSTMAKTWQNV